MPPDMASSAPRRHVSGASEHQDDSSELRGLLRRINSAASKQTYGDVPRNIAFKIEAGHRIRQLMLDEPHTKDSFRRQRGFETLISLFRAIYQSLRDGRDNAEVVQGLKDFLKVCFNILSAALREHGGNQRYFRKRVDDGGWESLNQVLQLLIDLHHELPDSYSPNILEQVFGGLLACAFDDETLLQFYNKMTKELNKASTHHLADPEHRVEEILAVSTDCATTAPDIRRFLDTNLRGNTWLYNPEALLISFNLWMATARVFESQGGATELSYAHVPVVINYIVSSSLQSLVAIHNTNLLSNLLPCLTGLKLRQSHFLELRSLALTLLSLGITHLEDAVFLYRNASSFPILAELILPALRMSHMPSYVHFDMSLHGFASMELPDIGRSFPPTESSPGYTLSMWLYVDKFDINAHTTLFGAFDSSQTCFVLVYLERDTKNLILQTSVTSSRPSVRFKSVSFREKQWYYIAIAHRRPRTISSSRASLFVNGEFVEQVKSHYPLTPPPNKASLESKLYDSASQKHNPIQAFVGTPQDLASRVGRNLVSSEWRLGSACLFSDVLNDDLIAVYYELGPRYYGNFQDCLGSFNTYRAAATLKLRNQSLHPGQEQASDIVAALEHRGSGVLSESKIMLNLSPSNVLRGEEPESLHGTPGPGHLSKLSARALKNMTRQRCCALAINGSIPSINQALLRPYGFAVFTGNPEIVVSQPLDDATWRIGGCTPVNLNLLESADTEASILKALTIIFESIRENWRNSEAMERENGFGILASLLATKLERKIPKPESLTDKPSSAGPDEPEDSEFPLKVLDLILRFLGYRAEKKEESVLNNPLAYRTLLVDSDYWRESAPSVQRLYYEQFTVFAIDSKYSHFNAKRLSRMRIIKKWLEALKSDSFDLKTFEYFLNAMKSMLISNLTTEHFRCLAMYITYSLHKQKHIVPQGLSTTRDTLRNKELETRRMTISKSPRSPLRSPRNRVFDVPQRAVVVKILELFTDLLCEPRNLLSIKKFAKTVTNKWLLHLLSEDDPQVVIPTCKVLARLLVTNGPVYVRKFSEMTGGVVIMQSFLKKWWNIPDIWLICFSVLFGNDVADIDFGKPFGLFSLLESFAPNGDCRITYPEILPVLTAMLQNGLRNIYRNQGDPDSPVTPRSGRDSLTAEEGPGTSGNQQQHGKIINTNNSSNGPHSRQPSPAPSNTEHASTLRVVTRFLADLHSKSPGFRDFTAASNYIQELLFALYPIVVSVDVLDPETELHSRDSSLTFDGNDVIIRPLSGSSTKGAPIVRTASSEPSPGLRRPKVQAPRRMSSYVLVISSPTPIRTTSKLQSSITTKYQGEAAQQSSHSIVEELLEIIVAVYSDEIFSKKDFPGLGLFMKTPPGFQEHQAYFETFILRNLLSHLGNSIKLDQKLLWEPRVLTNLGRLVGHLGEAIFEGWFIDGAEILLDFLGTILEYLQLSDVQKIKSVRLCSQTIAGARDVLHRVVLLRLSELDEVAQEHATVAFLERLAYWQTVILQKDTPRSFLVLFCFLLYSKLVGCKNEAGMAAANMWRMLLVQKAEEVSGILKQATNTNNDYLIKGFSKLVEVDNETFLGWAEDHREGLDTIFFGTLCKPWEDFVAVENKKTEEGAQSRISKRKEKLKVWASDSLTNEDIVQRHEASSEHWRVNIYSSEHLKSYRAIQDQQNTNTFNHSTWLGMKRGLSRPCGLLDDHTPARWQLDQTEGRNRMRLRFLLDRNAHLHEYLSKRKASESPARRRSTLSRRRKTLTKEPAPPIPSLPNDTAKAGQQEDIDAAETESIDKFDGKLDEEDDFEMVENPQDVQDYEDKNRKVLRSLHKDDPVEHIYNVSRIVGLEASEGLLVVGKNYLYLLDGLFQRSDSEIVNVWQAPQEERDPYLQMIAGREPGDNFDAARSSDQEVRSWRRDEVLSISKRRFLFRDVAMEIFFIDGRSYLLTTIRPRLRDELYQKLLSKISNSPDRGSSTVDEELWRVDSIQNPEDQAQSIGARFTSVFAQNYPNPIAKRWMRGEISNFHYLMLINTMAGRTFNDLTQYPVFPWVLADYTSEELDLSNPRSFRDLSKPMGCQTPERQAEFKDRYQSFAEMGDHHAPPFHYGTHYSTAMIVTSYLIRLQPFVQSYLLLQGGIFDHPDRLFYSIGQAWSSASRDNMTDVRELIPEFFYLPEFLINLNGYDFGTRQGNGGAVDSVLLPPWAKGDPKIFITKHREALESEYVSKNLHHWTDLIFGYKQQGEAALDATNVFHHLSYRGARDLDTIRDPVERLATIGIIHNFGQTPHQVFQRAHPPREDLKQKVKRLDSAAESLTRLPSQVFEISDNVTSLQYSAKHDRLLCSGPSKLHIDPAYDTYLAWGFTDGGIRFYSSDNHKLLGLFEHTHTSQLSTLIFADSKTLITAGVDCTISVWTVVYNSNRSVELQPKGNLFGHRTAVTTLAVSRSLRALLSGSTDGKMLLWDLNRLEIVRVLVEQGPEAGCTRIHDVDGTLMVCRGPILSLYTLNGDPVLEQNVCIEDDVIVSCAFYEGSGSEYLERDLVFTGHRRGVVNVWNRTVREGRFVIEHLRRLHHLDATGYNISGAITAVLPLPQTVYTGDEDGKVYEWDCVQRQ